VPPIPPTVKPPPPRPPILIPFPGGDDVLGKGRYPRVVGWSTGATDIVVNLMTGERVWYGDRLDIPETTMPESFTVIERSNILPPVRDFEMGSVDVRVTRRGVTFKGKKGKPKAKKPARPMEMKENRGGTLNL
jgi:hypothetical protein